MEPDYSKLEPIHSRWQKIKRPSVIGVIVASMLLVSLIVLDVIFYGTGFAGKTLWDCLQLISALAIPVVVGFGAVWFTTRQGKVADAANTDNQRETALQAYIDKMSELLLDKDNPIRESKPEDEVRKVARIHTLTILPRLDANRKRTVLLFLYESGLIDKDRCIIDLSGANLDEAKLNGVILSGASLRGVKLRKAELMFSLLREVDLSDAYLDGANLFFADLNGANLNGAWLKGAKGGNVEEAASLKGATMPDGSIHE